MMQKLEKKDQMISERDWRKFLANNFIYKPRLGDIAVPGLSHQKIFAAATAVKDYLPKHDKSNLIRNKLPHLMDLLSNDENAPISYEVKNDDEFSSNTEAITNGNHIVFKKSVWDAVEDVSHTYHQRYRFTMCHEIGHAILHSGIDYGFARMNKPSAPYESSEWQADTFSGYFLVTLEDIINSQFNNQKLAKLCNISEPAARKIIKNFRNNIM